MAEQPREERCNNLKYIHTELSDMQKTIRLLEIHPGDSQTAIHCSLTEHTIEQTEYECLSYVWGQALHAKCIYVDQKSFMVHKNLWYFLHTARRYNYRRKIWIDALCINQSDNLEKSAQVRSMGTIYEKAVGVIVWLGLSDEQVRSLEKLEYLLNYGLVKCWCSDRSGEEWLETIMHRQKGDLSTTMNDVSTSLRNKSACGCGYDTVKLLVAKLVNAFEWDVSSDGDLGPRCRFLIKQMAVLSQDLQEWYMIDPYSPWTSYLGISVILPALCLNGYWRRAWVVQELALARSISILAPGSSLDFRTLISFFAQSSFDMTKKVSRYLFQIEGCIGYLSALKDRRAGELSLPLRFVELHECYDYRDKVYSVLSLTERDAKFKVDYEISNLDLYSRCLQYEIDRFPCHKDNGEDSGSARGCYLDDAVQTLPNVLMRILHITPPRNARLPPIMEIIADPNLILRSKVTTFWAEGYSPNYKASDPPYILCAVNSCGERTLLSAFVLNTGGLYPDHAVWELIDHRWICRCLIDPRVGLVEGERFFTGRTQDWNARS